MDKGMLSSSSSRKLCELSSSSENGEDTTELDCFLKSGTKGWKWSLFLNLIDSWHNIEISIYSILMSSTLHILTLFVHPLSLTLSSTFSIFHFFSRFGYRAFWYWTIRWFSHNWLATGHCTRQKQTSFYSP